jgi:hypothetical protein
MKKQLSLASKRKWVTGGILAFSAISLLTTGFATWVVGVQRTAQQLDGVNVAVDTATNESVVLTAELEENSRLKLAEVAPIENGRIVNATQNSGEGAITLDADAMKVHLSKLNVVVGKEKVSAYSKVTFRLAHKDGASVVEDAEAYKATTDKIATLKNGTSEAAVDSKRSGTLTLTYFTFEKEVSLADTNLFDKTVGDNQTEYEGKGDALTLEFSWGEFFKEVSPANYYNNEVFTQTVIDNATAAQLNTYTDAITSELKQMSEDLKTQTVTIFAELAA